VGDRPGSAETAGVAIAVEEKAIPVRADVASACESLAWTRFTSPTKAASLPSSRSAFVGA
jgi:hypothetical protein